MKITGFPPIVNGNATILILGSMPGKMSLDHQQYYANPQNTFWFIMGHVCDARIELSYSERIIRLKKAGIALWDVLQGCERDSSLDSNIVSETEVCNDFESFLSTYESIGCIFFNGQKAAKVFQKHVWPALSPGIHNRVSLVTLTSTSPANARLSKEQKLAHWHKQLAAFLNTSESI
jgi:TDG/mug DNA glycosylase family protein